MSIKKVKEAIKLKGYNIVRILGEGGFAEVWLAEKDGKQYAIKIPKISVQRTLSPKDLEKFLREAEIWSKLKHKNIVKVFEYGTKPFPHIVMEYCKISLREKINELNLDEALNIALKVAEALEYAHLHGIVHRDIKPENILFCGKEPKLTDWGIAKILLKASTRSVYTGTPLYSAPEQLNPETFGEIDWRTDIWQFGCLLYEMIEGKPPFYAEYPGQTMINILTKTPRKPEKTPDWLKPIIMKCLEKKKEKRWRTITLIIQAIREKQKTLNAGSFKRETYSIKTKSLENKIIPPISIMPQKALEDSYEQATTIKDIALEMAKEGKIEEALKVAEKIEDRYKRNSAFKEIVLGMVRMGNFDAALKVAEKIEEDAYNRDSALKRIALGMLKAGMFEKALETAREIKNKRYRAFAFKEIALEMASMGNFDAALKVAEKIKNKRYRSSAFKEIALQMAKAGVLEEALKMGKKKTIEH